MTHTPPTTHIHTPAPASMGRLRSRWVGSLMFLVLAAGLLAPSTSAIAAPRGNRPYLRLFTEVADCGQVLATNQMKGRALKQRLGQLRRWYVHFHSEGSNTFVLGKDCRGSSRSTLAAKLSTRRTWVSNYRNGSFVSQASPGQVNFHEAANIERRAPLAIGTFWPGNYRPNTKGNNGSNDGRLTNPLSASGTTLRISTTGDRPSGSPATWPFVDSRGSGSQREAHSANTHDFVSWVRIGDELMQIAGNPQTSGGDIVLSVRRGLWGTRAVSHGRGSRVTSPIYIGNRNSGGSLSGNPSRDSTSAPLRYGIKIWKAAGYKWIAGRIQQTFGHGLQGFNAVWLDVSSCHQDNNADPYGNPVFGWHDGRNTKLQPGRYGQAQKIKLRALRRRFHHVKFTGNNMFQNDRCAYDLMRAYDGGVIENYLQGANGSWAEQMQTTFKAMSNNWPAIFWPRWDQGGGGSTPAYKRFTYGSVLLAYRPSDRKYQYGGRWDLDKPDELFFWNWGRPSGTPRRIGQVEIGNSGLYRRSFANGIVIVNPGGSSQTYNLGDTYYDVVNKNGQGNPQAVTQVTIAGHDAAFLLRRAGGG